MGFISRRYVLLPCFAAYLALLANRTYLHATLSVSKTVPNGTSVDAGVVLGYALHRNGTITSPLRSRVAVSVELFKQGVAAHLVFSGAHPGHGLHVHTEANVMESYAVQLYGSEPSAGRWLKEEKSTSTRTNAVYSLQIVRDQRWQSIVVVTNPFHQLRSMLVFNKAAKEAGMGDLQIFMAPAPFAGHHGYGSAIVDAAVDLWDFVREIAALVLYKVKGYI